MRELQVQVGESLDDIAAGVADAWHRMRGGEQVQERHVSFDKWEDLVATLTPKRLALLRHVHKTPARSVRALAQALGRDYRRVHDDVEALVSAGLLEKGGGGLTMDYDSLHAETRVAL